MKISMITVQMDIVYIGYSDKLAALGASLNKFNTSFIVISLLDIVIIRASIIHEYWIFDLHWPP